MEHSTSGLSVVIPKPGRVVQFLDSRIDSLVGGNVDDLSSSDESICTV